MHQDLLQFQTCQTSSMSKTQVSKIVIFWNHPDWCLWGMLTNITHSSRILSNQKPTLSKRSSYEKRCFKLEGHPLHATLPRIDHSKKRKKWMNKRKRKLIVISCTGEIRLTPSINWKKWWSRINTSHPYPIGNCSSV